MATESNQSIDYRKRGVEFVVGLGASAGGLASLEEFFKTVHEDTGFAFVVVQHVSPDFKSLMDEILARYTSLRIRVAGDQDSLSRNTVFLIPPGKNIELKGSEFVVSSIDREQIQHPIDIFFRSLAQSYGKNCAGVIFSGTGSDGTQGIREIHEAGGLTFVESLESAQFDGMPKNAIMTKCIDLIKTPKEIAQLLGHHAIDPIEKKDGSISVNEEKLQGISLIFSLLCERYDIDFAHYKPSTVARRIDRRLQMSNVKTIRDYAQILQTENG